MSDFEALYRQYWSDVYRFSLYLCGNAHDAEDLTEDAFLRAWMSTKPVRVATVKAYLFMIVRNLHIDQMRRARPREAPDEALPDSRSGPADAAGGRHELQRVLRGFQALPEIDRAVLAMATLGGMPYDLIAAAMGLSVSAVKVRVHRARLRLSEQLDAASEREDTP
jgi:RNA polymerase sigma-70 factor (ECF subfamily)